jgi:hypothetical protein
MTTVRMPLQVLRALKEPPRPGRIPKDDPNGNIGKHPFDSGVGDLAENHDFYLYGPVTYRPPGRACRGFGVPKPGGTRS